MERKRIAILVTRWVLLAFVGVCVVFAVWPTSPSSQPKNPAAASARVRVAYMLIGAKRCDLCLKIERWTKRSVEDWQKRHPAQADEVVFELICADEPAHKHYIKDYELAFKTVLLLENDGKGGVARWRNLQDVWEWVRTDDEAAFVKNVSQAIDAMMKAGTNDAG